MSPESQLKYPKAQVWKSLGDSLQVMGQYFVLPWPFCGMILLLMVIGSAVPPQAIMSLTPPVIAFVIVLGMIALAFKAGSFAMIYQAVQHYRNRQERLAKTTVIVPESGELPAEELAKIAPDPFEIFGLLKEFFPGVGEFLMRFVVGEIIHLVFLTLLILGLSYAMDSIGHLDQVINRFQDNMTPEQIQAMATGLSPAEQKAVVDFGGLVMLGVGLYMIFGLITFLWPMLVISHDISAWAAYGKSIRQFFRDPMRLIGLGFLYVLMVGLLELFSMVPNVWIASLLQFMALMNSIYFTVVLFFYTTQALPAPEPQPLEGDTFTKTHV